MKYAKVWFFVKWALTRVGLLILLWCLIAPQLINFKTIQERIKVRRLNDSRPDFHQLVDYMQKGAPIDESNWKSYQAYFKLILSYLSDDPVAQSIYGFINLQHHVDPNALKMLEQSAQETPLFWSDYNLGLYYYKSGQFQLAIQHLERALNIPREIPIRVMLGSIIYRQIFATNNYKSSLNDRINSAYEDAYILLLAALDQFGSNEAVVGISTKGLGQNFHHQAPLYFYAGLGCLKLKQLDKAALLFDKVIALEPKSPWGYFYLGKVYQMVGEIDNAQKYLNAFAALNSSKMDVLPYDQRMKYRIF